MPRAESVLVFNRINACLFAILAESLKSEDAVDLCIKRIIGTDTYVLTRMDVGTSLSVKDIACQNELTVSSLSTKSLGFRLTTVLGGAHSLFMSEKLNIDLKHYTAPPYR